MNNLQLTISLPQLHLDLRLPAQGICAIMGPSGAGKTTLLRAIAGLEPTATGRIVIQGQVWQDSARQVFVPVHRRPVGFVFQQAGLFAHLSVQANLDFGWRRTAAAHRIISMQQLFELLDIAPLLSRPVASLSGGEQQRVSMARALATSPQLLLMDEPLASLDEQRKAEILPYLERLHQQLKLPILIVSHDTQEMARLADEIVLLENGKLKAQGKTAAILSRPDLSPSGCAFVRIEARMHRHDPQLKLSHYFFDGGSLWLSQSIAAAPGATGCLHIQASDVSVALTAAPDSSLGEALTAQIEAIHEPCAGQVLLELDASGTRLLAQVSVEAMDRLKLQVGLKLFAHIRHATLIGS